MLEVTVQLYCISATIVAPIQTPLQTSYIESQYLVNILIPCDHICVSAPCCTLLALSPLVICRILRSILCHLALSSLTTLFIFLHFGHLAILLSIVMPLSCTPRSHPATLVPLLEFPIILFLVISEI